MEYRFDRLFIGGEWVAPIDGGVRPSIDPATGKPWGDVAYGGKQDIDRAVAAARAAFEGPWRKMAPWERAALIRKFADLYATQVEALARIESQDNGRAIRESRGDIGLHAQYYHWFASLADKLGGRTIPMDDSVHAFTTRSPVGVVGTITPWNVPLMAAAWKLGPALAAGCTVVLKPAEQTPASSLALAKLFEEAGFPPGVINVVPGDGPDAGAHLVSHRQVDKIAFTGEGATAKTILKTGADTLKRFSFELGGKAPHIDFHDADIERAAEGIAVAGYFNAGQDCTAATRVLAGPGVHDEFVAALTEQAKSTRTGLPDDEDVLYGALNNATQLERVSGMVDRLPDHASVATGGRRQGDRGYFYEPTVLSGLRQDDEQIQNEIFGPVITVQRFDDEAEALRWANGVQYGLASSVWTKDHARALRMSKRLDFGVVWINTHIPFVSEMPHGGFKHSGYGKDLSMYGLEDYTRIKHVMSYIGE
jgi:aldehyde dehydrogenase (NAD+)